MAGYSVRVRVLVVDDLVGPREAISLMLQSRYEVRTAADPRTALRIVKTEPIDLVVQDLGLPDGGGLNLLRRIKGFRRRLPVLVVSGSGTVEEAEEAMRNGASAFLLKPINMEELLFLVEDLANACPGPTSPV